MEVNTLTGEPCIVHGMVSTLNERAKMARLRAGFPTPLAASEAIGCKRPTVIRWEDDPAAKSISGEYLIAAARAYKVHPDWLAMKSDDDRYPWSETMGESAEIQALREEIAGLKAIFAASLSVTLRHRPLEAMALYEALSQASRPPAYVREVLDSLRDAGELEGRLRQAPSATR